MVGSREKEMTNFHPTVCNLCRGKVIYTTNDRIYGRPYGSGHCYYCTQCGAYVGTHKPWPREALGLLADAQMRSEKMSCHEIFDSKWRGQPKAHKKRNDLYAWLAKKLGIPFEECHFGNFDLEMLNRAYAVLLTIRDVPLRYDASGNIVN